MIRVDMIRSNGKSLSRCVCEVAGRRYATTGPAPIYRIATLLWLDGHGGEDFEVYDDRSPFGGRGGYALAGQVRNFSRVTAGGVVFDLDGKPDPDLTAEEHRRVAGAAGEVEETAPLSPEEARLCASPVQGAPAGGQAATRAHGQKPGPGSGQEAAP